MMAIHLPLCVSNAQVDALVICKMNALCMSTANIIVLCEILIVSGKRTHHLQLIHRDEAELLLIVLNREDGPLSSAYPEARNLAWASGIIHDCDHDTRFHRDLQCGQESVVASHSSSHRKQPDRIVFISATACRFLGSAIT